MKKKFLLLILIITLLTITTACSTSTHQYIGEYITFNYSDDWEIEVIESRHYKQILLKNELNSQIVLHIEEIKGLENEEGIREQLEREIAKAYQMVEKMETVVVVSYEDKMIGGEKGRELKLELDLIDTTIEQLYYTLKEDMIIYDEIKTYLGQYEGPEEFISVIKREPDELENIEKILVRLQDEAQSLVMQADNFITNIKHFLAEEMDTLRFQNNIMTNKENIVLKIYIESREEGYEESVQEIVDSINWTI
ncbi:MAG: hypothetical protein JJT76_02830 [Clostridiaceae bacterium]|nr:hypothetical protein [Clostridiaceae bacterium]